MLENEEDHDEEDHDEGYDAQPQGFVPRPCDKCGAGDIEYTKHKPKEHPLCREVQMAFGLVAWLCIDCRREWHKFVKNHELNRKYMKAQMALEFWKARVCPTTPPESLEEGIKLIMEVDDLELLLNDEANKWLINE